MTNKCMSGGSNSEWNRRDWIRQYDENPAKMKALEALRSAGCLVRVHSDTDVKVVAIPNFTEPVSKGAEALDREFPEWYVNIDTSALDLQSEEMCVLGQTWSHYARIHDLSSSSNGTPFKAFMQKLFGSTDRDRAAELGFSIPRDIGGLLNYQVGWREKQYGIWDVTWEALTTTWLKAIRDRQQRDLTKGAEEAAKVYDDAIAAGKSHGQALVEVAKSVTVPATTVL